MLIYAWSRDFIATHKEKFLQASHRKSRKASKGIKRAPARLARIIQLVRVPQKDFDWPESLIQFAKPKPSEIVYAEDLNRMIMSVLAPLPKALRRHLRELINWGDKEPWKPAQWRDYRSDPLYADLPIYIQQFDTGWRVSAIINRYQEVRSWRNVLLAIARGESPAIGRITRNEKGEVVWIKDDLERCLDIPDVNLNYIQECSKCGSVYYAGRLTYQTKAIEPHCSPRCGRKIRQARSPRRKMKRPPGRLDEVRKAIAKWQTKDPQILVDEWSEQEKEIRPSQIKRCLDYLQTQNPAKETNQ